MGRGRKSRRSAPKPAQRPDTRGLDHEALADLVQSQIGPGMLALADEIIPRTTEHRDALSRRSGPVPYATAKSWGLTFRTCRAIGDQALINSAIHQRRKDGIRGLCRRWSGRRHQVGWAVVHKDHNDPRADTTQIADLDKRIERAERILLMPHERHARHLEEVLIPLLDDRLCIDRPALNVLWNSTGTEPVRMVAADGASIWPVDVWTDTYVRLNGLGTGEYLQDLELGFASAYSEYGHDLTTKAWVQVDASRGITPIAFLDDRELIVAPANKTSRLEQWGYGRSPCEASWIASTMYLFGIGYVLDFFKNGMANKLGILEGITERDAVTLVNILRTQHTGSGRHHHTPFIPAPLGTKVQLVDTRATAQEMEYGATIHHVAMLICAFYSEDSGSLNLTQRGPGQSSLSEPSREAEQMMKRSEGLIGDMHFVCDRLLTPVIQMIDPDLKVIAAGIDDEKEELEVKLRTQRVDKYMSQNEARLEEGREPLELPPEMVEAIGGLQPFDLPGPQAQAAFQAILSAAAMQRQTDQQREAGLAQGAHAGQEDDDQHEQYDGQQAGMPHTMRWEDPQRGGEGNPDAGERLKSAAWIEVLLDEPPAAG